MKTALIKKNGYHVALAFMLLFCAVKSGFAQSTLKTPYPIIFVHGLNSSDTTWGVLDGKFDDVVDYLKGAGLTFGGRMDVALNYKRSATSLSVPKSDDVHLYGLGGVGDFYTVNFDVHATGTIPYVRTKMLFGRQVVDENVVTSLISLSDASEIKIKYPDECYVNDIIRIGNEFMRITSVGVNSISVARHILNSKAAIHFTQEVVYDLSNESNQASIAKQGYGLKLVIDAVKSMTHSRKVILVGHSMGGLAIREYIRTYQENDVAKIVTIGTPHYGADILRLPNFALAVMGVDGQSDAARDLRANIQEIFPIQGIYLFGGPENVIKDVYSYYSGDVDGNGSENDYITGLNSDAGYATLKNISKTYIASSDSGKASDGIVPLANQYIYSGDTLMTNRFHTDEPRDYYTLLRGLDEPGDPAYAYEIQPASTTKGFITFNQGNKIVEEDPKDIDLFKLAITAHSTLTFNVSANNLTGIDEINLLDADLKPVHPPAGINQQILADLDAGTYFIQIKGTATHTSQPSYNYPYTLTTIATPIAAPKFSISPSSSLPFYDVVLGQYRAKNITLTNNGTTTVSVSKISVNGSDASQFLISTPTSFTVDAGKSQTITLRFKPSSVGVKNATIKIESNSTDNSTKLIALTGTGTDHATKTLVVTPDSAYHFGDVTISDSKTHSFSLQNTGSDPLVVTGISTSGMDSSAFVITPPLTFPFTLQTGSVKPFAIRFSPNAIGSKSSSLLIDNNSDNYSPSHTVALYGNGTNSIYSGITGNAVGYEYWFDDGYSGKKYIPVLSQNAISVINTSFPTTGLSTGTHILQIRFKDKNGQWSCITSKTFVKQTHVAAYEYWFDQNYDSKVAVSVSPGQPLNLNTTIDAKSLPGGLHHYNIRFKDDDGQWSSVVSTAFSKIGKIVAYEYWFDQNYDAKVTTNITPAQTFSLNSNINVNTLAAGLHHFNARFKGDNGQWSALTSNYFYKKNNITAYRYWFDTDYAHMVAATVSTTANPYNFSANINTSTLPNGQHTIHFQFRDYNNSWSTVTTDTAMFYTARPPTITAFTPTVAAPGTTVTITGTNFNTVTAVKFGGVAASSFTIVSASSIMAVVGPGTSGSVSVTNPDGTFTKAGFRSGSSNALLTSIKVVPATALTVISGPDYRDYTTTVPNTETSVKITPTTQDATATIKINGTTVASGTASAAIPLNIGDNIINTIVTAQDGVTTKTYSIKFTRLPSTNASLAGLTLSSGTLSPVFAAGTTSYTATTGAATITVTPTAGDAGATIKVNGTTVASGTASAALPLAMGANVITTEVTASDGTTTKTYTLTVTRLSNNAALTSLKLNPATTLTVVSGPDFRDYTTTVPNSESAVKITPTTQDTTAIVKVNGVTVASGTASASIPLSVGDNIINTIVTAQDGVTTKTYSIKFTRLPSTNANLAGLTLSSGTLSPIFAAGTTSYTATVSSATITVTPTASDADATIKMNGTTVASGMASAALPLVVGPNVITTVVTASNGTTTKTYMLTITRLSNNATLSGLKINPATTLTLAGGPDFRDYTTTVPNSESTVKITPTAQDATSTIKVNGVTLASGTASAAIPLSVGTNVVNTEVTAQDGITAKTYSITFTRTGPVAGVMQYDQQEQSITADALTVHQNVSPNGDGNSDVLVIDGITAYPENKVQIMNRSGALIYETKGYNNATNVFDGHSSINGKLQQAGTYMYSLEYKDGNDTKHKTGFIVLKY